MDEIQQLFDFGYNGDFTNFDNGSRAILCPTNAVVKSVNNRILDLIEGDLKTYISIDEY